LLLAVFLKWREEAPSNTDKLMHGERPQKLCIFYIMYIGSFQTLKKRRQRQKRCTALHFQ
jgi:hypothetical protein